MAESGLHLNKNSEFYRSEREFVAHLKDWAIIHGWTPVHPDHPSYGDHHPFDLVLERDGEFLRIEVKMKNRKTTYAVRVQMVPTFREAEFVCHRKGRSEIWEIELGGVPIDKPADIESFQWLIERLSAA